MGKVFLVGAGPGDYKLITVRGLELLKKADCIVYDRLVNKTLLSFAKSDCELIYVGKKPNNHTLKQEEINELLLKKARVYNSVVRLKGGDPFIFGRGGEEADYLFKNGIECDVVPGISSSYACPNYAGIPVTHRGVATSFHIITGNNEENGLNLDFEALAKVSGTLIFLMSIKNIDEIIKGLVKFGKSDKTPAAVIHFGTTIFQKAVYGNLSNIVDLINKKGITSPSIFVVGEVVKLNESLNWLAKKPLFGKKILITRDALQATEMMDSLYELGAFPMLMPTIKIEKSKDTKDLDASIKDLKNFKYIIFTSTNGVRFFFERMKSLNYDVRSLKDIKIVALGEKIKRSLIDFGIYPDIMPEKFSGSGVLEALSYEIKKGDRVLYPTSDISDDEIKDSLEKIGAKVCKVIAYKTRKAGQLDSELLELVKNNFFDVITFTSSSCVNNFFELVGDFDITSKLISIGEKTSSTIKKHNKKVFAEAKNATIDEMINVIKKCL